MRKPCNSCVKANAYKYPSGKVRYYCGSTSYRYCDKYQMYDEFLESKRQYIRGKQIKSVQEYLKLKESGQTLFYWYDCIRHIGWLESMQFRVFVDSIQQGHIYNAIKK